MDELSRRVEALTAMAQKTGGVGLGVEVQEEGPIDHRQTPVKDIEAVLQFNCESEWNSPLILCSHSHRP